MQFLMSSVLIVAVIPPAPGYYCPYSAFRSRSECLGDVQPNKPTCLYDLKTALLFTSLLKQVDGDYPPSI